MKMAELVAELDRLLLQQQKLQAQLPDLQPSLCRKAMTLHREVKLDSSAPEASCWMWLRAVHASRAACYCELIPALENQVSVANR